MRVGGNKKSGFCHSLFLLFIAASVNACGKIPDFREQRNQGTFTPNPSNGSNSKIDILFVIDSSGTMSSVQSTLASSFSSFINSFTDKGLQYHIGVTTTDTCPLNGENTSTGVKCNTSGFEIRYWEPGEATGAPVTQGSRYPGRFNDGIGGLMSRYDVNGVFYTDHTNAATAAAPLRFLTWNMVDPSNLALTPKQVTIDRFQNNAVVGTIGGGAEAPLSAAIAAIDRGNVSLDDNPIDENYNSGFFRPGAFTVIVIVTDEDESFGWVGNDSTTHPPTSIANVGTYISVDNAQQDARIDKFLSAVESLKGGNLDNFVLGVIAQPVGSPTCGGAGTTTAVTLDELVNRINSDYDPLGSGKLKARFYDMCAAGGFGSDLDQLAADVVEANARYALDQIPDVSTIVVLVNGGPIAESASNGWQYDSVTNAIQFFGSAVPGVQDEVQINYTPL